MANAILTEKPSASNPYVKFLKYVLPCLALGAAYSVWAEDAVADDLSDTYEVEYVKSTGKQIVDTKIVPGTTTSVEMHFGQVTYANGVAIFGQDWSGNQYLFNMQGNSFVWHGSGTKFNVMPTADTDYDLTVSTDGTLVLSTNGTELATLTGMSLASSANKDLAIFGCIDKSRWSLFAIYSMKIWQNGILKRDFVPFVQAGVAGLYDKVDGAFYVSDGDEPLVAGPRVKTDAWIKVAGEPYEVEGADPDYGYHTNFTKGVARTFTCPAAWTNAAATIGSECLGWTLTLADGTETTGDELEKTIVYGDDTAHSTLTWRWSVKNKVTAEAKGGGSVSNPLEWVPYGNAFESVATAGDGKTFRKWTDASGAVVGTAATFASTVTSPQAYSAWFSGSKCYVTTNTEKTAVFPYDTVDTAAHSLADALLAETDEIEVGEGTYLVTGTMSITRAVKITGAGMDKTILKASGKYKQMFYLNHKDATISGVTVTGVRSPGWWGFNSIAVQINAGRFEYSRITDCSNTDGWNQSGGGASLHGANAVLSHCRIDNNSICQTGNGGGGVMVRGGGLVENCLIDHNKATYHGGVYFYDDNAGGKVVNCTIVDNTANNGQAGGVYFNTKAGQLINCIVRRNVASGADGDIQMDKAGTVTRCASREGFGTDPVTADPEFTDAANGDYSLLSSSHCMDAGSTNAAVTAIGKEVAKDLAGADRVSGPEIDLGCYEFDQSRVTCAFSSDKTETLLGTAVTLSATNTGFAGCTDLTYTWKLTVSGTETSESGTGDQFAFTAASPGRYDVKLTASSDSEGKSTTAEKKSYFYVAPLTNFVTNAKVDTAAFPYGSSGTAATNIADAIAAAIDGSVIQLPTGKVEFASALMLKNGLTLRGEGMTNSVLHASAEFAHAITLNHPNAVMEDLTLEHVRGGGDYTGCAVDIKANGGTMRRCRVTDCDNGKSAYITGVVNMGSSAGRITHCLIDDCHIGQNGGHNHGGGAVYMSAGLLDNCVIANNSSPDYNGNGGGLTLRGGKAVNCTIYGNALSSGVGGGVYKTADAILENCIVYGNSAPGDTTDPTVTGAPNLGNSTANVNHCLVGQQVGTDPIAGTPDFMDAANGDFSLVSSSPCRDIGTDIRYMELLGLGSMDDEVDFVGFMRLSGSKIDAGAYEYDASSVNCAFGIDTDVAFVPATFTLTPSVEGFSDPEHATLTWTFAPVHGGKAISVEQTGTNVLVQILASNEQYKVTLAVSGGGQSGSFTRADPIYAAALTNYVTAATNAVPVFPYSTPETATTNVAEAIETAVDGATILIGEGTNLVRSTLLIEKAVTLTGISRDSTWLKATSAYGPLVRLNHADSLVRDLTIADGKATLSFLSSGSAAGVDFDTKGGTLVGCRVTGCGAARTGSGNQSSYVVAIYLHSENAVVSRCAVDNINAISSQTGYSWHSGGSGILARAGRVDNCVISNVLGVVRDPYYGIALNVCGTAKAVNCTVISNSEYLALGGVGVYATVPVRNIITTDNYNYDGEEKNMKLEEYFSYCLSPSFTTPVNGNVIGRPVFRKSNPVVLEIDSPGWHAGSSADYEDVLNDGTDLLGHKRVRRIRKNGIGILDIGCTENEYGKGLMMLVR